jgi:hypothetical protein
MRRGHQCGMAWGAALAVGAECARRYPDRGQATGAAIAATRGVVASFSETAGGLDCREITGTDFLKKLDMLKYMLFKARHCFALAERWAPEAIRSATEGLSAARDDPPPSAASCPSEVARRMGATDAQAVAVAGFAGGLGLSGHGCGALAAAIWLNTLTWCEGPEGSRKSAYQNPSASRTLETFQRLSPETRCDRIVGRRFETIGEHTEHLRGGGCERLIEALAHAS